jgi:hypothetical protein
MLNTLTAIWIGNNGKAICTRWHENNHVRNERIYAVTPASSKRLMRAIVRRCEYTVYSSGILGNPKGTPATQWPS